MTPEALNRALATELMLWHPLHGQWHDASGRCTDYDVEPGELVHQRYWNPAGDWDCVGEVWNRLTSLGYCIDLHNYADTGDFPLEPLAVYEPKRACCQVGDVALEAPSPQVALCRCALAVVRGERSNPCK